MQQHYDTYNEKYLKRMAYKKIDGQQIKEDEEEEGRGVPEPVPYLADPFVQPDLPEHLAPATSSSTIQLDEDQIEEIMQRVFDRISSCLSSLVKNAVREIFAKQHSSMPIDPASSVPPDPSLD